ncbi:MAG: type I methionyl aminopeptidase [bacterium]
MLKSLIKTEKEIDAMRAGGKILAQIVDGLGKYIQIGISTMDIDNKADELCQELNVKPAFKGFQKYPNGACVSINDEIVHGIPAPDRILHEGDLVSIDYGIWHKNMCTDMARTFAVGEISTDARKLITITEKSLQIGIAQIKNGTRVGDIGQAIQKYAENNDTQVIRELVGHGVGREIHEPPQIPNFGKRGQGEELLSGMTIAIEPMLALGSHEVELDKNNWTYKTIDGSLSCHFENTILVTDNGVEILTTL